MSSILSFSSVSKNFGHFQALDDISFSIEEGDFYALLGPNGAGKTTLLSILTGLQRATSGTVTLGGFDVVRDYQKARRLMGAVPQELVFDPFFTVQESLEFQSGYFGIRNNQAWIGELLESLHLSDKAQTNTRKLSGGMKRRLMVAQALVHRPPLIVLDEPTAGVDVEIRRDLWKFIRRLNETGHTILLTTHYLQEAEELANRIGMLKLGRLIAQSDKHALMQRYAASTLRFRLVATVAQLPADLLAKALQCMNRPDAKAGHDGSISVPVASALEIEECLSALRMANLSITEVVIHPTDLEEVFLKVLAA